MQCKRRREAWSWNRWSFPGAQGLVIRKIEVFGVSKLCLAEKYLNCKMDFLLYQDDVCSYNLEILNWDVKKTVIAMISRSHCSLGSGRWHNPGNTASPSPSARFPHVTLMVTSARTNFWCLEWFCRNVKKGTTVLKLEAIDPQKYLCAMLLLNRK